MRPAITFTITVTIAGSILLDYYYYYWYYSGIMRSLLLLQLLLLLLLLHKCFISITITISNSLTTLHIMHKCSALWLLFCHLKHVPKVLSDVIGLQVLNEMAQCDAMNVASVLCVLHGNKHRGHMCQVTQLPV